ncbi:MAG: hypothetical protein IPI67_20140 [Myxococcales bacterium]|nr:hypothetical protein [Myxococcales bacterium]
MRSTWRGLFALGTTLLVGTALASGCSSSDGGGGGGSTSTGGKDGGTGGTSTTGGTGGGGTGGGGTGGGGGCKPAPDPNSTDACDVCQNDDRAGCACDTEIQACLDDAECSALWDCVIDGEADGGVGACPPEFSTDAAACVSECAAVHPTGKALYLAMEKCQYCTFCGAACDTGEYCTALDNPSDAGPDPDAAPGDAAADSASD